MNLFLYFEHFYYLCLFCFFGFISLPSSGFWFYLHNFLIVLFSSHATHSSFLCFTNAVGTLFRIKYSKYDENKTEKKVIIKNKDKSCCTQSSTRSLFKLFFGFGLVHMYVSAFNMCPIRGFYVHSLFMFKYKIIHIWYLLFLWI